MFQWVVVGHDRRELLVKSIVKSWRGGHAVVCDVELPARRGTKWLAIAWADGASPRRDPRWPEVLTDWSDINDERLFPEKTLPIVAEEVSGLGADAFIAHGEPGLERATVAWYGKGAVVSYEHVGSSTVAWTPEEGLGRPFDGTAAQLAARGYKKLAALMGSDRDVNLAERIAQTNQAVGELLISRAFLRLLDTDPPEIDELAGLIARAKQNRWPLAA
jgi:hypothetical protein